ncbi:MAG: penicillin-binding protein [Ignavibacteriaceae bacterium]
MNNGRLFFVVLATFIVFIALIIRLVDVQLVRSEELRFYAQRQQSVVENIVPARGLIYDRDKNLLVYNRNDVSFYVDTRMAGKKDKKLIAQAFARFFNKEESYYEELLAKNSKIICIEKKVFHERIVELKELKINGLFFEDEPSRIYRYENLASHILGYVNTKNSGVEGVEKFFDNDLTGEVGRRIIIRDAKGKTVTINEEDQKPSQSGKNLQLTIDKGIQSILEEELRKGKENFGASNFVGIVMDPGTGEILAMSSMDDFNPNKYSAFSDTIRRNKAVTDAFEPGSTFKAVTLASFLDKGICKESDRVFLENGRYKYKKITINDSHAYSWLDVKGVFSHSSNIGMSKLSQQISKEDMYVYLRGFGLGNFTYVNLPSEVRGTLRRPDSWTDYTKSSISFGYEVSVTPIQMASVYSSLINGGILYQPTVVKRVLTNDGSVDREFEPKEIRRVISEETSARMRKLFQSVVEEGTGKKAKIDGITIGGKTGTSRQIIQGQYSREKYNSTFIGFFPVDKPKYLVFVLANSPSQKSYYGGDVAAPVFRNITSRIIDLDPELEIKTEFTTESHIAHLDQFKTSLDSINGKTTPHKIKSKNDISSKNRRVMPDLRGLSIRDAIFVMSRMKLKYSVSGNGRIVDQSILPGTKLISGSVCRVNCEMGNLYGAKLY